jgi:prepilin-type N-terminal cleavage/methylation domain-containing protein
MKKHCSKSGFTIVELLVVIVIIGILIGMFLPATRSVREAARRTQCLNNLRQMSLACINYNDAQMHFPSAVIGAESGGQAGVTNGIIALLPFMEYGDLHEQISQPATIDGIDFPAWPDPLDRSYPLWKKKIPIFTCPSVSADSTEFAPIHYGMCIGDRARNLSNPKSLRGMFAGELKATLNDVSDGSSNTILFAEICSVDGASENPYAVSQPESLLENPSFVLELTTDGKAPSYKKGVPLADLGRGAAWSDGRSGIALFNTILPPNSPSAAVGGRRGVDGIYSASGPHPETVNIVRGDGSAGSISLDVNSGVSSAVTLTEAEMESGSSTPYGVWGALGTIAGGEVVDEY